MKGLIIQLILLHVLVMVSTQDTTRAAFTTRAQPTRFKLVPKSEDANCADEFEAFKIKYNKKYADAAKEAYHKGIFCKTLEMVNKHNSNKTATFKIAINQDSDTDPAKNPRSNGLKLNDKTVQAALGNYKVGKIEFPKQVQKVGNGTKENVHLGKLTGPVKDQGSCGSCWTYAAATVIQYNAYKLGNKSVIISEQDMLDCNSMGGSCDGGNPITGLLYSVKNGSAAQATYPYRNKRGICKRPNKKIPAVWQGYDVCEALMKGNDAPFNQILDYYGAAIIAVASHGKFTTYSGGVYTDAESCGTEINHAVALVGYGYDNATGLNYWVVKNSWGPLWGEDGYIRMQAGVNMCGIGFGAWVLCKK